MKPEGDGRFRCFDCSSLFSSRSALSRHKHAQHAQKVVKFQCPYCEHEGSRLDDVLRKHVRKEHLDKVPSTSSTDIKSVVRTRVPPIVIKRRSPVVKSVVVKPPREAELSEGEIVSDDEVVPASPPKRKLETTPAWQVNKRCRSSTSLSDDSDLEQQIGPAPEIELRAGGASAGGAAPSTQSVVPAPPVIAPKPVEPEAPVKIAPKAPQHTPVLCAEILPPAAAPVVNVPKRASLPVAACQTGTLGASYCATAMQSTPSIQRLERIGSSQTSPNNKGKSTSTSAPKLPQIRHHHIRRTIYYPDGRKEVIEENLWFSAMTSYPCCHTTEFPISDGLDTDI